MESTLSQPIVSMRDVQFTYLGEKQPAVEGIDLDIESGDFVLILGPSGSGKSTLVNLINGTVPKIFEGKLEGDVIVDGLNTREHKVSELATVVGHVLQDPESQIVNVLVKDEVYFGLENLRFPPDEIRERGDEAVSLLGIDDLMESDVFQLSGGQKQKVALASVLAMRPKILVLDQPTANLDPQSTRDLFALLGQLNEELGITIVIVEHRVDQIAEYVNKVVAMDEGRIVASGSPRDVWSQSLRRSELGLWTPQVIELALELDGEFELATLPLTMDDACQVFSDHLPTESHGGGIDFEPRRSNGDKNEVLVDIRDLTFMYEVNNVRALSNVDVEIHQGDFLALIGKNGAGKSTLSKILVKVLDAPRGTVFIEGRDIRDMRLYDVTSVIGYIFQNPDHQFVEDNVFDEVAYSLRVRGADEGTVKERVNEILEIFSLKQFSDLSPFALSRGYRRLLSVATMLVVDKKMIILDEPTIGQDQVSCARLMSLLDDLNKEGKTIVVITHDMRLISEWAGRGVILADGEVLFNGPLCEAFQNRSLLDRAGLVEPPLVTLTQRLQEKCPDLPSQIMTSNGFCEVFRELAVQSRQLKLSD